MKNGPDPITARDIEAHLKLARTNYRNDPRRLATFEQWLGQLLAQQRMIETGNLAPPTAPVRLTFRQAPEGWLLGFSSAPRTCTYPRAQDAPLLAHAAFSNPWKDLCLIDILPGLVGECRVVGNSLRNARGRLATWIESHIGCKPLADAVRAIQISNGGYCRFDPNGTTPCIDT